MKRFFTNLRIEAGEAEIKEFLKLCATINILGLQGTNRSFKVTVDGDGSGFMKFKLLHNEEEVEFDQFDVENIDDIYIGE